MYGGQISKNSWLVIWLKDSAEYLYNIQRSLSNTQLSFWILKRKPEAQLGDWIPQSSNYKAWLRICVLTWLILSQSAALAKVSYHKAEHSEHTHERPENIMGYIKNNKNRGLMEPNLPPVLTSLIAILHYSSFPNL